MKFELAQLNSFLSLMSLSTSLGKGHLGFVQKDAFGFTVLAWTLKVTPGPGESKHMMSAALGLLSWETGIKNGTSFLGF